MKNILISESEKKHILNLHNKLKILLSESVSVGDSAPELKLIDFQKEREILLTNYFGKPIILMYYLYSCSSCISRMKQIANNNTNKYTTILATYLDYSKDAYHDIKSQKEMCEKKSNLVPGSINGYDLSKSKIEMYKNEDGTHLGSGNHYGGTPPKTVLINSEGNITYVEVGTDEESFKNALNELK